MSCQLNPIPLANSSGNYARPQYSHRSHIFVRVPKVNLHSIRYQFILCHVDIWWIPYPIGTLKSFGRVDTLPCNRMEYNVGYVEEQRQLRYLINGPGIPSGKV